MEGDTPRLFFLSSTCGNNITRRYAIKKSCDRERLQKPRNTKMSPWMNTRVKRLSEKFFYIVVSIYMWYPCFYREPHSQLIDVSCWKGLFWKKKSWFYLTFKMMWKCRQWTYFHPFFLGTHVIQFCPCLSLRSVPWSATQTKRSFLKNLF